VDQGPLVAMQIEDGKRLVDRLLAEGVPVTAAGWIKEAESGFWFLYLVTPLVTEDGAMKAAYWRVNEVIRKLPQPWPYLFAVKLLNPKHPVAEAMVELQRRYPGRPVIPYGYGEDRMGDLSVDGAYLYPPAEAVV